MSDTLDGLSNIYAIQAKLEALKSAKSSASSNTGNSQAVDPDTFLIQTQQNFNQMLNTLITSPDEEKQQSSSDYLSYLESDASSSLNTAALQKLAAMEQFSPLIGRTVTYYGTDSNEEKSGVISKITFSSSSAPILVLQDGTELPAGAVTGLK